MLQIHSIVRKRTKQERNTPMETTPQHKRYQLQKILNMSEMSHQHLQNNFINNWGLKGNQHNLTSLIAKYFGTFNVIIFAFCIHASLITLSCHYVTHLTHLNSI